MVRLRSDIGLECKSARRTCWYNGLLVAYVALRQLKSLLAYHNIARLTSATASRRAPDTARGGEVAFGLPLYSPLDPRAAN